MIKWLRLKFASHCRLRRKMIVGRGSRRWKFRRNRLAAS